MFIPRQIAMVKNGGYKNAQNWVKIKALKKTRI